jgi:hypothetical protein
VVETGGQLLTAVMTIPVAAGTTDGTASPDTAHVVACLATTSFSDGQQGSTQAPPKIDCTKTAAATYDAKKSTLTVNLGVFAQAWSAGTPPLGVALVPDPKAGQPSDAWHVTINGRKRAGAPHVRTVLTYTESDLSPSFGGVTSLPATGSSTTAAPLAVSVPPAQLPAPSNGVPPMAPPVVAGQQPPATTVAQQPVAFTRGAPPTVAFVAPLLLLAGGIFFARAFTRDATPLAVRS